MPKDLIGSGRLRVGINRQDTRSHVGNFIDTDRETLVSVENYDNGNIPVVAVSRATGGVVTPANVANNDQLGSFAFQGYSDSFLRTAAMEAYVDAAVVAGQRPASRLVFKTNVNNATPRLVGYISNEGYHAFGTAFDPTVAATRAAHPVHVVSSATGQELFITAENYDDAANATFRAGRARGTFAAPTTVVTGDILGEYEFYAYTNQWHHCAEIISAVHGAVVAGQTPDSDLRFYTTDNSVGGLTLRARLMPNGDLILGSGAFQTDATIAANFEGRICVANNLDGDMIGLYRAGNNANGATVYGQKSRGTIDTPATVATNDELLYVQGRAYTNAWHGNVGAIAMYIDGAVTAGQRPGNRIVLRTGPSGAGGPSDRLTVDKDGNIGVNTTSFGTSSQGVLGVANAAVIPAGNPAGGGVLYAEAGAGKWRGSGGTITTFGPADPHCPVCGLDFGHEWERTADVEPDPAKRYMAICLPCLVAHVDSLDGGRPKPFVRRQKPIVIVPPAEPKPPTTPRPQDPPEPPPSRP